MSENRLTEEELDQIADALLAKMLGRLTRQIASDANKAATVKARKDCEPTAEDFARLRARRKRLGRK